MCIRKLFEFVPLPNIDTLSKNLVDDTFFITLKYFAGEIIILVHEFIYLFIFLDTSGLI